MSCSWQKRIKTNTITTINKTKKKTKNNNGFAHGSTPVIEKKTKQLHWAEERIHSDEKKKKERERERELLRAHKTVKEKKCFAFFFLFNKQISNHDDKTVNKA